MPLQKSHQTELIEAFNALRWFFAALAVCGAVVWWVLG